METQRHLEIGKNLEKAMIIKESELLKEMYYFEVERKNKLSTSLSIPIGILTFIFGIITFFLRNISCLGYNGWVIIFFCIFFILTIISLVCAIVFLIRSFYKYKYKYLPMPSDIENDIKNIKEYYKNPYFKDYKKEDIEKLIEIDFFSLFPRYYKQCIKQNINNNDRKSLYLHKTSTAIILIIIFLFLSSIPFNVRYYINQKVEKIQKVEIIKYNKGGDTNAR